MRVDEINAEISEAKQQYYRLSELQRLNEVRGLSEERYLDLKEPHVFIYTPTYNRGSILRERALQSVLDQTYTNFTYLVVGDACTDDTESIVAGVGDARVRYVSVGQRNWRYPPESFNHWLVGPVAASNLALSMAFGDWIARLDDDDVWVPDHLERSLDFVRKHGYEFVSGRAQVHGSDGSVVGSPAHQLYGEYFRLDQPADTSDNPNIGGHSSWVYRSYLNFFEYNADCWRKTHNKVNDTDLIVRMGLAGVRIGFSDSVHFIQKPRPGEKSTGSSAYLIDPEIQKKKFKFN
jgi:glycosyltransferase involved in cell wall biosynthesis